MIKESLSREDWEAVWDMGVTYVYNIEDELKIINEVFTTESGHKLPCEARFLLESKLDSYYTTLRKLNKVHNLGFNDFE